MTLEDFSNISKSSLWETMQWTPSKYQLEQFLNLQKLLAHFNEKVNLTRLVQGEDYWVGQIFDSLWPIHDYLQDPQQHLNCIDVGTGCGFPGLAIAIALPQAMITLVDATRKKTLALNEIAGKLELSSSVQIINDRIEVIGQDDSFRGRYDLAMARAVSSAPVTAEYLIPLIKKSGEALLFRGQWSQADKRNLLPALKKLNASIKQIQSIDLPAQRGKRHVIRIESTDGCPTDYPRHIGIPSKKPLGT